MSTTPFRNIALLGASGNVGSRILSALHTAGFNVTAIQREESKATIPAPSKTHKVDFSSPAALTAAFAHQDVVVSALPNPRLATDKIWMDAAITAGVRRLVPSEFSTNLETDLSRQLPIVAEKLQIRKYVESLAAAGKVEWSSVNNGPFFLAMAWTSGFLGPSPGQMMTTLHDGGHALVGTSTLERIGEGVAAMLKPEHAALTRNQPVYVYSTLMSETRMTEVVARVMGKKVEDFKVNEVNIADVTKDAFAAFEKGDMSKMYDFYVPFCLGEGYGGDTSGMGWMDKLGLKVWTEEEVEGIVASWIK